MTLTQQARAPAAPALADGIELVGRFEGSAFDPAEWKPRVPAAALAHARGDDTFWAARRVAAFTDDMIRAIVKAGEAARRVVTVFQNRRWDADFLTLKQIIAEGALGEVVQFESHFDRWRPTAPATWKEARAGGSWQDLGPHLVDQALQLFGRPESITADIAALREGAPGPDYFHVTLRYPGRRVLLHSSKLVAQHSLRFAVHGTRGSWIKHGLDTQEAAAVAGRLPGEGDWGLDPLEGMMTHSDGTTAAVPNARGDYRQLWLQLAAAIRGEGRNPVPASDGVEVIEIIEAGLLSAAERREVSL